MDVKTYSDLVGVSKASIHKRLRIGKPPKAIKAWKKFGNSFDLDIDTDELKKLISRNVKRKQDGLPGKN